MKYTKTIRASQRVRPATRPVRASRAALRRRAIKADVDLGEEDIEDMPAEDLPMDDMPMDDIAEAEVNVDEAASELLFEAEDVAELVSEVSGLPVDVTVDEDEVTFTVGDDTFTVTPEGDEEIVEESTRVRARRIAASRRASARRVAASRRPSAARKVAASRRVSATRRTRR